MATYELHHLHHETADVDSTVAFYQTNFAAELIERTERDGVQWGTVRVGGALINVTNRGVFNVGLGVYNGLDHFALRTTDLDATVALLKANGVNFFLEPMTPKPGVRIAFVSGPDNVKIELLQIDS